VKAILTDKKLLWFKFQENSPSVPILQHVCSVSGGKHRFSELAVVRRPQ